MRLLITSLAQSPPPPYERLGVRLWRHGCAVWSPLVWLDKDTNVSQFTVVAQAQLLLVAFARRRNDEGQLCDVLIATAAYTAPQGSSSATTSVELRDHCHDTCQVTLRLTLTPDDSERIPDYMLLTQAKASRKSPPRGDYEDEFIQAQREEGLTERLIQAKPLMVDFDEMVRGEIRGPLGRPLPILDWLQHVTSETQASGRRTPAMYFTWLATWYLQWRQIRFETFQAAPHEYAEILSFLSAHHTWTYPYCTDDCLDPKPASGGRLLRPCDTWATGRWIPSPLRATDCEDNAADIVATLRALQRMVPDSIGFVVANATPAQREEFKEQEQRHRQLARALKRLARQYTPLLADTTLWMGNHFALHMYVKLVPTEQLDVLLGAAPPATDKIGLPILTVDSTRRCWTPASAMDKTEETTLTQLHATLRSLVHDTCVCDQCVRETRKIHDNCQCRACSLIQTVGEFFSWGTPCDMWQKLSSGMYHTDLRYYDVVNGRVYLPRLPDRANAYVRELPSQKTDTLLFGVPALSLDGFLGHYGEMQPELVPQNAYKLPAQGKVVKTGVFLTDVTDVYLQQGQFGRRRQPPATTNAALVVRPVRQPPTPKDPEHKEPAENAAAAEPESLPPVPRIEFDFRLPLVSWREVFIDAPRIATIPVFIRPIDARACTKHLHRDYRHHWLQDERQHMFDVACLLEVMSIVPRSDSKTVKHSAPFQRNLRVMRMERMYVQEPQQYVYVYYVTAVDPMPEQQSLESYLAPLK